MVSLKLVGIGQLANLNLITLATFECENPVVSGQVYSVRAVHSSRVAIADHTGLVP